MRSDPLLVSRDLFPIVNSTTYLISNSLGAMPREVEASLQEYAMTWSSRGVRAWEETWWAMAAEMGDRVAPLIGARTGEVVFQPTVTLAHAVIFSAFDFARRPKIVTDAMHFPSVLYLLEGLKSQGAEIEIIPSSDGQTIDAERVIDAIDERTAFVNVSHVLFKSAFIQQIDLITEKAKRVGAISIIDGYQSVGTIPVDVRASGADVYIGGCLKWLCGGPGNAFLWVDPDRRASLSPRLTGWMAHARPFAFEIEQDRRTDAWGYLHGTPSIPALHAARPGLDIIGRIGIDAIRAKSKHQTARLLELADARGWPCTTPRDPERRGGTVAIDVSHGYEVSRVLKKREILCDFRPGAGIRLSPHFYTNDDELVVAIEAIAEILEDHSWTEFRDARSVVT